MPAEGTELPEPTVPMIPAAHHSADFLANPFVSEPPKPRHPATANLLRFFEYEHLPPHLRTTSRECHMLAHSIADRLPDGPELSAGLRKLLEAKDCFVRAALDA